MVKCACYTGLWIHWFCDLDATIPNSLVTIGQTSLVGVGYSRLDSIVPLMLRMVCYAMARALILYYRSLETSSTLLRRGNILGRPCMRVMTYTTLDFSALKTIRQLSPVLHLRASITLKPIEWCISRGNAIFLVITQNAHLLLLNGLMPYLSVRFTY
jgi:hypothetical protein